MNNTHLQPVAVDSILVRDLDLDELCDPEIAKGPYPTDRLADVDEADTALSSLVVSPENYFPPCQHEANHRCLGHERKVRIVLTLSSISAATTKAVGYEENC